MGSESDTRMLLPFLKHLKTDPVVVNYSVYSHACGVLICAVTFTVTFALVFRIIYSFHNHSKKFAKLCDNIDRILAEQKELLEKLQEEDNESNAEVETEEERNEGEMINDTIRRMNNM